MVPTEDPINNVCSNRWNRWKSMEARMYKQMEPLEGSLYKLYNPTFRESVQSPKPIPEHPVHHAKVRKHLI